MCKDIWNQARVVYEDKFILKSQLEETALKHSHRTFGYTLNRHLCPLISDQITQELLQFLIKTFQWSSCFWLLDKDFIFKEVFYY